MTRKLQMLIVAGIATGLLATAPAAGAATITPLATADTGTCTLRDAFNSSELNMDSDCVATDLPYGNDTIQLGDGTYALTLGSPLQKSNNTDTVMGVPRGTLTISHAGSGAAAIDGSGNGSNRLFEVNGGTLNLSGLALQEANLGSGSGGAILAQLGATINLTNMAVTNNDTGLSGGGHGGGVAVFDMTSTANLTNVTISGNRADQSGGGLYVNNGTATLNNVTVTGNTADAVGVPDNSGDGGGIARTAGTLTVRNTIASGNLDNSVGVDAPDCAGTITSAGYNLIGTTTGCTFGMMTGDQIGAGAMLGGLALNGGPTQTHALGTGSAAIDTGNPATPGGVDPNACAATDQRGVGRPQGSTCDKGAFEAPFTPPPSGGGSTPPAAVNPATGPTGQRAAALKKCAKIKNKQKKKKCKKRARALPV